MEGLINSIKEMEFETFEDLYERREEIREKFKRKDKNTKKVYKWYFFYQLCCMDYEFKSTMWDFMYEIGGSDVRIVHQYKIIKNKKEKYHQKYLLEEEKQKKKEL